MANNKDGRWNQAAIRKRRQEHLRQLRRRKDVAIDCFIGKLDLLKTYEQLGIQNEEVQNLAKRVGDKRTQLVNRGCIPYHPKPKP